MTARNDLSGLLAFIERDEAWLSRLEDVASEHLGAALVAFDLEFNDLADVLGDPLSNTLWGCGFEDFLGQRYDPDQQNIIDLYLKRRGWKESVLNREYLAGLRDTPASLYEVSNVMPGETMALRDLLSDAPVVIVRERSATKTLRQWDKIAARVVRQRDHHVISGAVLKYSNDAADLLRDGLRKALKTPKRATLSLTSEQKFAVAPLITSAWLLDALPRALEPEEPYYTNMDGDPVVFHDLHFPLKPGVTQKELGVILDEIEGVVREGRGFWNWLEAKAPIAGKPKPGIDAGKRKTITLGSNLGDNIVLGTIETKGRMLHVSVNSASRAARAEAMIMAAMGDLVRPPLTTARTLEEVRAEPKTSIHASGADEIPPDISAKIMREYMDRHYRKTIDEPVPALGGKSPREAVKTAQGREQVADWLKYLENNSTKALDTAIANYDFSWMWAELGIESLRR